MRKLFFIFLIGGALVAPFTSREVKAMDPVTIAILAPVAVKCAEIAGAVCMARSPERRTPFAQNGGKYL